VRVVIVNQPFSFIEIPRNDAPLSGDSIGLWTYQVATRLAKRAGVVVYTPGTDLLRATETRHAGVDFVTAPVPLERRLMSTAASLRRRRRRPSRRDAQPADCSSSQEDGDGRGSARPGFASYAYYPAYPPSGPAGAAAMRW
jgi:hypothetical protein